MKPVYILLVLTVLICSAAKQTAACDCFFGGGAVCQDYWKASAVFLGTVIESRAVTVKDGDYSHQMRSVRISIDESFRGVEGAEVEILTGFGGGDCGFGFRQSQQYLIYAYEYQGKLATSICTRTKSISEAEKDLGYIRGLAKAKPGSTISGEIVKRIVDERGVSANQPLKGITITIEGNKKFEVTSDAAGLFRIDDLPAGDYVVKARLPEGLATYDQSGQKVSVSDRGCAAVYFSVESNGRLGGRVLNPNGLPVPHVEIVLVEAGRERYQGHSEYTSSDGDGRYAFRLIPPGHYVLLIRSDGMTSQQRPFPTTYYPGVSDISQARVFTFGEGQVIQSFDLEAPPVPAEYTVQGTVLWSDGKPAPQARVGYEMVKDAIMYGAKVDEQGHFSFKAYEGLNLVLRASIERDGKSLYSDWVRVTVGPAIEPVKIILTSPERRGAP